MSEVRLALARTRGHVAKRMTCHVEVQLPGSTTMPQLRERDWLVNRMADRHVMQIASITMTHQFPDGIDLHVRNLKWFLDATDYHIYIITLPERLEKINIKDDKVTFITKPTPQDEFTMNPQTGWVDFWSWFPAIVKHYKISPEWFLFMEQDLWFFEKFDCAPEPRTVKTFYPHKSDYHNIMLNDRVLQPRIWEGAHLISAEVVNRAIDFNIKFAYYAESFLDRDRERYEMLFGGKISISMWTRPETMGEFSLYCALEERLGWNESEKAVHLVGPEVLHRNCPQTYNSCDQELLDEAQNRIPRIDVYLAIAIYYIAGNWKDCKHVKWDSWSQTKRDLRMIALTADQWMTQDQYNRLLQVLNYLDKEAKS